MYLPLIAVLSLFVFAGHALLRRLCQRWNVPEERHIALAIVLVAGVAAILGSLTFRRNMDYSSELTIWRDTFQRYPSTFARINLGGTLAKWGQADEALTLLRQAAEDEPNGITFFFIGQIYRQKGELERARRYFELAIQANPKYGAALHDLGVVLYYQGKTQEAVEHLRKAAELEPNTAVIHTSLAVVLDALGERAEADAEYRRALRLDPDYPTRDDRAARALSLSDAPNPEHRRQDALFLATKANRATGESQPEMLDTLAMAYAANDRFDDALAAAKKGLDLAQQTGDVMWLATLPQRLKLYAKHRRLREE